MTDQDNGLLYQCKPEELEACLAYIKAFAELGTQYLNYIGYPFCPGNVMATNKRWSNEIGPWIEAMKAYLHQGQPDDIKYLFIASDMRGLYGDLDLVQETKKSLFHELQSSSFILKRMHDHIQEPKASLGFLGNIITERFGEQSGKFNVKLGLYVPLVNTLKFLAIKHGVMLTASLERLQALFEKNIINNSEHLILKQALEIGLYFRWLASLNSEQDHSDFLDLRRLSEADLDRLKVSLKEVKTFQSQVIRKVDRYE